MKSTRLALCATAALAAMLQLQIARGDTAAQAKAAIKAQYARIEAGFAKRDARAVLACYTKDHTETTEKGATGKIDDVKAVLADLFSMVSSAKTTTAITSFSLKGDTAAVGVKTHFAFKARNPKTGADTDLIGDEACVDTWVKTGGAWLMKSRVTKTSKKSIN